MQTVNDSLNILSRLTKNADWGKAYTSPLPAGKMVKVPVNYAGATFTNTGNAKLALNGLTRLFIYTDKKNNKHIEVVTSIPDDAYLNNHTTNKRFSGVVWVTNWQGKYIKGFKFKGDGSYAYLGVPTYTPPTQYSGNVEYKYKPTETYCVTTTISGYNVAEGERYDWSYSYTTCINTGLPPGPINNDESLQPGYYEFEDGGCGRCTAPLEPESDPKDPCIEKAKIKAKAQNAAIEKHKTDLQAKLAAHADKEWGIEQNLDAFPNGNYKNTPIKPGVAIDAMDFTFYWDGAHGYTTGFIHDHPSGSIPNPTDAFALLKPFENAAFLNADQATKDLLLQNITSTVVLYDLTYVMTIKDLSALRNFQIQYNSNPTAFIGAYRAKVTLTGDYEGALLSSLGSSINLYRADANSNEYKPIVLNNQNASEVKPCPTN